MTVTDGRAGNGDDVGDERGEGRANEPHSAVDSTSASTTDLQTTAIPDELAVIGEQWAMMSDNRCTRAAATTWSSNNNEAAASVTADDDKLQRR